VLFGVYNIHHLKAALSIGIGIGSGAAGIRRTRAARFFARGPRGVAKKPKKTLTDYFISVLWLFLSASREGTPGLRLQKQRKIFAKTNLSGTFYKKSRGT
jgi:hypothetical protein